MPHRAKTVKNLRFFQGFSRVRLSRSGASWGEVLGGLGSPFGALEARLGSLLAHKIGQEGSPGAFYKPYAMLCYAMFIEQKSEPGRKRSAATQNLRQKVQNERQEASGDPT